MGEETLVQKILLSLPEPEDLELPAPSGFEGLTEAQLQLCFDFAAAHPNHWVAAEVLRRKVPMLRAKSEYAEAAEAQGTFATAVQALLGSKGFSWHVEILARHAYLLELSGRREEAIVSLRQMIDTMKFAAGRMPPASTIFDLIECPKWWT